MFRAVPLTNQSLLYDSIGPRHEVPLTSPACQRLRPAHRPRQILQIKLRDGRKPRE